MQHVLTFDIEDWFQVFYGEGSVKKSDWGQMPAEFPEMMSHLIDFLEAKKTKATFFVVGWLADKYPQILRAIDSKGHEIGSHGYWHTEVFRQSPAEFSEDLKKSKNAIEQAISKEVKGYRAPGYSIPKTLDWAPDLIKAAGYKYDSSLLFAPPGRTVLRNGLLELAPNSIFVGSAFIPANGGFAFRLSPYWVYRSYIKWLEKSGTPLCFYTHSWETRPTDRRLKMSAVKKFIQYHNTDAVAVKLARLLTEFKFVTAHEYLELEKETH